MGVPLAEVRQHNHQHIEAALNGFENDLVGVLSRLPYEQLDLWVELLPCGHKQGVENALGAVYDACMVFLRRQIAKFDLPYPREAVDGIVPENTQKDASEPLDPFEGACGSNDAMTPIEVRYVQLPPEDLRQCTVVLQFVAFAVMKARDCASTIGSLQTRAWVTISFMFAADAKLASISLRLLLEMLTSSYYVPPYSTVDVVLDSALLIPCGNGSTPQSAKQSLAEFVESDELAAWVVTNYADAAKVQAAGQHIRGPDATRIVSMLRLSEALKGPQSRVALVELQVYSLCVLFALSEVIGFDELTGRRAPSALAAVGDLTRAPKNDLLSPLRLAVADTLWLALDTQTDDDDWPNVYAMRVGFNAQLNTIETATSDKTYLVRLLSAVNRGLMPVASFLPGILKIATDESVPADLRLAAANCMIILIRDEDMSPNALRSQNAYALLVRELSRTAAYAANAATDWDAQLAADLAGSYVHLFKFWIKDHRTPELEHALVNSDFFEACADLADPALYPFVRRSTPPVALHAATSILDPSRIEPLVERGTVEKFVTALHGLVDADLPKLETIGSVHFSLTYGETDIDLSGLYKHIYQRMLSSPWFWTPSVCQAFVTILGRSEHSRQEILSAINEALNWAIANESDFPPRPENAREEDLVSKETFNSEAANLAFGLLGKLSPKGVPLVDAPLDDPAMIRKVFDVAQRVNVRNQNLQYYAAQNLDGCVANFLFESALASKLATFLLALDKVSLAADPFITGFGPPNVYTYNDLKPMIVASMTAASLKAADEQNSSVYSNAVLFVLKDSQFLSDTERITYIHNIVANCEHMYAREPGSGNIRHLLLFLRAVTVESKPLSSNAAAEFIEVVCATCRILCVAFKHKDEPTRSLAFSVLGHLGLSGQLKEWFPLTGKASKQVALVIDAALESEKLRAQVVVPPWFGKRDEHGFLIEWKRLFPTVAEFEPEAVLKLASTFSDRDFARNVDLFLAAGDIAVAAMRKGKMGDYLELVACIANRLQFPWVSFEKIDWVGAHDAVGLVIEEVQKPLQAADLVSLFGPLSTLLEYSMCLALSRAHEENLPLEEQLSYVSRSALHFVKALFPKLVDTIKSVLQFLLDTKVSNTNGSDEKTQDAITGMSWLLVRFVDCSPDAAQYVVSSGLFRLLSLCSSGDFRQHEQVQVLKESEAGGERKSTEHGADPSRAMYRTADSGVANAVERGLRAVTHAISTAGVVGQRLIAMMVDTPRVAGFNELQDLKDIKGLILRRPELRRVALAHTINTSRGLAPLSNVPGFIDPDLPSLDFAARENLERMVAILVPAYLGDDLRMSEVCGLALVDLVYTVGTGRCILREQYPDLVKTVIRKYGPRIAPADPRLGGSSRDTYMIELSTRLLSVYTVQGLDEPYSQEVRDSLKQSCSALFAGICEVIQNDVKSYLSAGNMDQASFLMFFIANVLLRVATLQPRVELSIWCQLYPDGEGPPFLKSVQDSRVLTVFLETFALLDPTTLAVRMFRDEVLGVEEEYLMLEGHNWPHKADAVGAPEDESDDNDLEDEGVDPQQHEDEPMDRDIFRNSVLGDIDAENAEEDDEYTEDEDMDSMDGFSGDEVSFSGEDDMSFDGSNDEGDEGDRMSIVRFASEGEESTSSGDDVQLLGERSGEEDSDPAASPEVIETIFSSDEEYGDFSISEESSDSELDEFDPESPDADTQMPSDVNIVLESMDPRAGHEFMNGLLLRFSNELGTIQNSHLSAEEELGEEVEEEEEAMSYFGGAMFSIESPRLERDNPVLGECDSSLAWWSESALASSEIFTKIDLWMMSEAETVPESLDKATMESVRLRQASSNPAWRSFGAKRALDIEKMSATLARALFTTVFEQGSFDMSQLLFQLLNFREGRDKIAGIIMATLFIASSGDISTPYASISARLGVPPTVPRDATPSSVCANCVSLLRDVYEANDRHSHHVRYENMCRRLSRYILRVHGSRLIGLLTMPQICQNRKLLNNTAVLVLHVLSIMGKRRFDSSAETLARLAKVLGLRECTSESFSALAEIIRKYLRTDMLLPNIIRETRRARSSLLVLLPAVAKTDVVNESVDAFATEQVKLLRLMSLLNRVYEPQQVLAALKSVNLLPLWHSVGKRLNNGTLDGTANSRGFASGVSLLESFALALSAAVKWKPPVPDTHPALTKYAQWVRAYLRSFMSQHKSLINDLLRARPNLYLGPMGEMARTLNLFDFQSKEKWFRSKMEDDAERVHAESSSEIRLSVRRRHVLEDTFEALYDLHGVKLRMPLYVHFQGEEAVDAGGVTREWLELIAREILNPEYALFTPVQEGSAIYQVNRSSGVNPNHLDYFLVVGRILGRAVYDGRLVGLYFSRVIYKYLLGRPNVTLADMEAVDDQYHKSLVWMLEMDVTGVIEETFSVEGSQFGEPFVVDLIENGRNIAVTEENKKDYVKRIVEYKLVESVKDQLEALRRGFNEVVSPEYVDIFDEQELELLLCGLPTISVEDWRANTAYVGYQADSPQIRWFWTAVASFSTEDRAKLLQFSTGTSRVPVHGFSNLRPNSSDPNFQIHKEHGSTNRWPSSHTCMNQINLPAYESYKKLRAMLLRAIDEGVEGFGFV